MATKKTQLLRDDPATEDAFGTHKKIAELISNEILDADEGRSIALVGEWGSGKSTVIELLRRQLDRNRKQPVRVFIYDAWSHQGDSLRRAFLDDFIAALKDSLDEEQVEEATQNVWNRAETTTTTTEPVLRRHAKILLLTIAAVPLGMELFDAASGSGFWGSLVDSRNMLAYPLMFLPVIAVIILSVINRSNCAALKDYLFGRDRDHRTFSILSFFFERVQGKIERKQIKSPVDSIRAFRDVFISIVDAVHKTRENLRVVIIIDNIDRIPADQAREFWSTMQTFFSDGGGLRKSTAMKYWLVAPFSEHALSFVFRDSAEAGASEDKATLSAEAKGYIDKTFGLAFYVPPIILTNWRNYLRDRLKEAFPEHSESELIAARDVYDVVRSGAGGITPREMKIFVNNLVALYRQREGDIALPIMSAYILHKAKIVDTNIQEELLTQRELRAIGESNWRVQLAALHFGVSIDQAEQLLLQEPIIAALREGSRDKLRALESRPGFYDVLPKAIIIELESTRGNSAAALAATAASVAALDGAPKVDLFGAWRSIRTHLTQTGEWNGFQIPVADGVAAVLTHTPTQEKKSMCERLAVALSKTQVSEPEGDLQNINKPAENWVLTAQAVVECAAGIDGFSITIPGEKRFQLEVLQQLAERSSEESTPSQFKMGVPAKELSNRLSGEIGAGIFLRDPVRFVSFIVNSKVTDLQWSSFVQAAAGRLRTSSISPKETQSHILLLLAIARHARFDGALAQLKELSIQGHLSNLLYLHRSLHDVAGCIVAAIVLANPAVERSGQVEQSQNGDTAFNELLGTTAPAADLLPGIAATIERTRCESLFFQVGAANKRIAALVAAALKTIVDVPGNLHIEPGDVVERRGFLDRHQNLLPIALLVNRLAKRTDLLAIVSGRPFEVSNSQLYRATVEVAKETSNDAYLHFLEQGIGSATQNDWDSALNTNSSAQHHLLELALQLREIGRPLELSIAARDAALEQVRKIRDGTVKLSDEGQAQFSKLTKLLPDALQASLFRDVVYDLVGSANVDRIDRVINLCGGNITFTGETDPDRIVLRIFSPIVGKPSERSAGWMAAAIGRRLEFFRAIRQETREEFGLRLRASIQHKDAISARVLEALTNVAELLELDLTSHQEAEAKTEDGEQQPRSISAEE